MDDTVAHMKTKTPKRKMIQGEVTPELFRRLKVVLAQEGKSVRDWITECAEKRVKEKK